MIALFSVLVLAGLVTRQTPAGPTPAARDSTTLVLSRLAFGPAPGQIDEVARSGVLRWIDQQLEASSRDDHSLAELERSFDVLQRSAGDRLRRLREIQRERRMMKRDGGDKKSNPDRDIRRWGAELQQLTVVRATFSDAQLAEVMTDFWFNHFNVFFGKGIDRALLPDYVERTIRPRVFGRFEDLLLATARSPAMLIYLDNAQSVAQGAMPPGRAIGGPRRPTGPNENYARELLELHTVGVDGGYTQADVIGVARILTGWSFEGIGPRGDREPGFRFRDWAHDRGEKTVLGIRFPAGHGEDEGKRLLELLAERPATMHFVSRKLCARFVADLPPDGCVDAAVDAWRRSHGEIRKVLRAIFHSPEFWAAANRDAKIKTPFEFVVSALRALGAEPDSSPGAARAVARLGQPLYQQVAPTGYGEREDEWVNSGALLARMNLGLALAANRVPGVTVDLDDVVPAGEPPDRLADLIDDALLGGRMSPSTRAVVIREAAATPNPTAARAIAVGLALGSPEFQRQ